ncbi:MAG: aminotransferase class V-fold PLP-dependent enzyme [Clostridium sp.]|nr:aminotransferase class V-fold PLP-dependent enzyme [Clostridium sp.]
MYSDYRSKYRSLIAGVDTKIPIDSGKSVTAINFDNAATTPPFVFVLNEILRFSPWYSSIHRGEGYKSTISSKIYENSRKIVLDFVGADLKYYTAVYVKNTTEAINKLSNRFWNGNAKDVILSTFMEHHSNDLPWRKNFKVDYVKVDSDGKLDIADLKNKLEHYKGRVRLVAVAGASNVTGYMNPVHDIAKIAHKYNAKILVDAAQLIPHVKINMEGKSKDESIDFLAFSAHKMYAPFGTGVLIGPIGFFYRGSPDYVGGGTIDIVTHDFVTWNTPPDKDEAGTPNIMGVIALISAIKVLKSIGMDNVENYEKKLTQYALDKLSKIDGVKLYCTNDSNLKVGVIPFNIIGIEHDLCSQILSYESGISVRDGCFCAQPYVRELLQINEGKVKSNSQKRGMVRISFGLYNDFNEIDTLVNSILKIIKNREYYNKKFNNK